MKGAPNPCSSTIFTLDSHLGLSRNLGVCQLVLINGYYISGYWWLFVAISGNWLLFYYWLLVVILLMAISNYSIIDYYFIIGYWWLFY
jgi:hypothetical protein